MILSFSHDFPCIALSVALNFVPIFAPTLAPIFTRIQTLYFFISPLPDQAPKMREPMGAFFFQPSQTSQVPESKPGNQ